jgi:hypothetical protein
VLIPSEFCLPDGVPKKIKESGQAMRQLLNKVKQTPQQKLEEIANMVNKLLQVSYWSKWDIQVNEEPEVLESRRLDVPELIHNEGTDVRLFASEPLLKKLPVYNADRVKSTTLILLYDDHQVRPDVVDNVQKGLANCQRQMGMQSKDI